MHREPPHRERFEECADSVSGSIGTAVIHIADRFYFGLAQVSQPLNSLSLVEMRRMNSCLNSFDSGKGWLESSYSAEVLYFELDCGVKQGRWARQTQDKSALPVFLSS